MRFNLDHIGDKYGIYTSFYDDIEIFLGTIWHDCKKENRLTEQYVIAKTIEIIIHEYIHQVIDMCLEKPDEIEDHNVFNHLYI